MNKIEELRSTKGLSRAQLARKAEITERYLVFVEQNQRSPSMSVMFRIAEALECEINEIFLPPTCTNSTPQSSLTEEAKA